MKTYKHYAVGVATLLAVLFLASCNAGQANVSNSQTPLFASAPGSPITTACGPTTVVVGDLNKDGKPDLIVSCEQAPALTVLLGTGDASFRESPWKLAVADINGDAKLDVVTSNQESRTVSILLGQ